MIFHLQWKRLSHDSSQYGNCEMHVKNRASLSWFNTLDILKCQRGFACDWMIASLKPQISWKNLIKGSEWPATVAAIAPGQALTGAAHWALAECVATAAEMIRAWDHNYNRKFNRQVFQVIWHHERRWLGSVTRPCVYISYILLAGFCYKSVIHCRVYWFLKSCLVVDIGSLLIASVGESLNMNLWPKVTQICE